MILEGGAWQSRLGLDSIELGEDTSMCIGQEVCEIQIRRI